MAELTRTWKRMPAEEWLDSGHKACQGCGAALAMRHALRALGAGTTVVIPACCWTVIEGEYPRSSLRLPVLHTAFETAAAAASGVRAAQRMRGEADGTRVLAWAGDGGTFDIGLQSLSGAAERNEDIIYVCYDNEAYMNTGIQRSSATPLGAWTTTTPARAPEARPKKDIIRILAAHDIPYAASATAGDPEDLYRKLCKARDMTGTRFIHLLSPCPAGWKTAPSKTVSLARLAVETRVFPLFEVEEGRWRISHKRARPRPVRDYLEPQGRFRHLSEAQIEEIQRQVDARWRFLLAMESLAEGEAAAGAPVSAGA